jgi:hypothetical protein
VFAHCYRQELPNAFVNKCIQTLGLVPRENIVTATACSLNLPCVLSLARLVYFPRLYIISVFHMTGISNVGLCKSKYITCVNLDFKHGAVLQISQLKVRIYLFIEVSHECIA